MAAETRSRYHRITPAKAVSEKFKRREKKIRLCKWRDETEMKLTHHRYQAHRTRLNSCRTQEETFSIAGDVACVPCGIPRNY